MQGKEFPNKVNFNLNRKVIFLDICLAASRSGCFLSYSISVFVEKFIWEMIKNEMMKV